MSFHWTRVFSLQRLGLFWGWVFFFALCFPWLTPALLNPEPVRGVFLFCAGDEGQSRDGGKRVNYYSLSSRLKEELLGR